MQLETMCSNPSNEMLVSNPELNLWDFCDRRTFPFFKDVPCDCRKFTLLANDKSFLELNYTVDDFNAMFLHWSNLQTVRIKDIDSQIKLYFEFEIMFQV